MNLSLTFKDTQNPKLPWLIALTRSSLDELEREYLRIGAESCNYLKTADQLSAFLLCGIGSLSLLRTMLSLLEPNFLDAHSSLHRAFLEAWYLQFEFRFSATEPSRIAKWFTCPKIWKAKRDVLQKFVSKLEVPVNFNMEYSALSCDAHPTVDATYSSRLVASACHGMSKEGSVRLKQLLSTLSEHYVELFRRELWLTFSEHPDLLQVGFKDDNLVQARKIYKFLVLDNAQIDWGEIKSADPPSRPLSARWNSNPSAPSPSSAVNSFSLFQLYLVSAVACLWI